MSQEMKMTRQKRKLQPQTFSPTRTSTGDNKTEEIGRDTLLERQ